MEAEPLVDSGTPVGQGDVKAKAQGVRMLRVGVVGTNFVSEWFLAAASRVKEQIRPVAIYSRTQHQAQRFSSANGLPLAFSDFDAMLEAVDAVYIASPTSAHCPQAISAIAAGKHVLVEKTMAGSAEEAAAIFAAAAQRGVIAMEATRHLHTPMHQIIRDALPQLGTIRYAHFEKLQYSSRYDRFLAGEPMNAFDRSLGNSALADIGVYCLEPAIDFFGAPLSQTGCSVRLENGYEAGGAILLQYPSHVVDLAYSKIIQGVGPSTIVGEAGILTVNDLAEPRRITLQRRGEAEQILLDTPAITPVETMHYELEVFAKQVEYGEMDPRWQEVTVQSRVVMDRHLGGIS